MEEEVGLTRAFGGRLERDRTAVGFPGDSTCRQFYHRNDASAAHAGLKRALTPKTRSIKLYLAATNVRTGKVKVLPIPRSASMQCSLWLVCHSCPRPSISTPALTRTP